MPTYNSSSPTSAVFRSGNWKIDALLEGVKWHSSLISYSFPHAQSFWSTSTISGYGSPADTGEPWSDLLDFFTPEKIARVKVALQQWSNVSQLRFLETRDDASTVGDIRLAFSWIPDTYDAEAWAYIPSNNATGGDIWFNTESNSYYSKFVAGSYGFTTLLHELGHALGLKHPHDTSTASWTTLGWNDDALQYTIMSYQVAPGKEEAYLSFYPTTPMVYDIEAIQYIYGKNTAYNASNTIYNFDDSTTYFETIWDGGGINTLSYNGTKSATINLNEGQGSRIGNEVNVHDLTGAKIDSLPNVWIAYGTTIHNAAGGSGNNTLIGNAQNNVLTGGKANNHIYGDAGNDTLVVNSTAINLTDGGNGLDTLVFDHPRSGFTITYTQSGFTVTHDSSGSGSTTVTNMERIKFSDAYIALDINGNAGAAYRLYQAAFDRAPDKQGLGYWINKLDHGMSLIDVATGFFNAPEFKALYGSSPTNTDYITRFYGNVLHRAPDDSGFSYWMNELTAGHQSPVITLVQFSESPENQAQLTGAMQNGVEFMM